MNALDAWRERENLDAWMLELMIEIACRCLNMIMDEKWSKQKGL